jgi:hypothetical protein
MTDAYKSLVRKPLAKCPPRGWEGNIKIHFREIGCENWRRMKLAQDYFQWWALVLWC